MQAGRSVSTGCGYGSGGGQGVKLIGGGEWRSVRGRFFRDTHPPATVRYPLPANEYGQFGVAQPAAQALPGATRYPLPTTR